MIPPQSSLVKYNSPILVSTTKEKALKSKKAASALANNGGLPGAASSSSSSAAKSNQTQPVEPPPKPTVFTGSHTQSQSQTEDILNSILPPKEWTEDGQLWVQYVSSTPATRLDVVNLQEQLDLRLQQRQARETGICPVREELYAQCFGMSYCLFLSLYVCRSTVLLDSVCVLQTS
ncbi:hypothetical protein PINS_up015688 [Pythium insidiosum]|nr:hypothetical protein PINS_up006494 [Pythium insidiosum]GLE06441.1 hypothetical protein PINS_up015688 [Pythium insidiosum]